MAFGKPLADRLPHHLEIGTGAMQHHDRRAGRVARADIDNMEGCAGNLDHPALGRMGPLVSKTPACVTSASTASAATTITTTIEDFRLIFCTNELRPGSVPVSEVVHRGPILWIAGSY